MMLYFHQKLAELRMTYREFFRLAYLWKFGQLRDLTMDCGEYHFKGKLPPYVVEYLHHLEKQP